MPIFVCYSRFNRESRTLRSVASNLGWETLRIDGWKLPEWVETTEPEVVIFATVPEAFDIAEKFNRTLLGCGADWLVSLPKENLRRHVRKMTVADALDSSGGMFVK